MMVNIKSRHKYNDCDDHNNEEKINHQSMPTIKLNQRPKTSNQTNKCTHDHLMVKFEQMIIRPLIRMKMRTTVETFFRGSIVIVLLCLLSLEQMCVKPCDGVVVERVRFVATPAGRSDYALVGENVEMSCHYLMRDDDEKIHSIIWTKDGQEVIRYRATLSRLDIVSRVLSGHVRLGSTPTYIMMTNVTLAMHGTYSCNVETELGQSSAEISLVVVTPNACRQSDWHFQSNSNTCTELIQLDCGQFHPRPVPACGLWNARLGKFISALPISIVPDRSTQISKLDNNDSNSNKTTTTYRVSYSNIFQFNSTVRDNPWRPKSHGSAGAKYPLAGPKSWPLRAEVAMNLLRPPDGLRFRCELSVPDTTWRLTVERAMYYEPLDCYDDPLEYLASLRRNLSSRVAHSLALSAHAHQLLPPKSKLAKSSPLSTHSHNNLVTAATSSNEISDSFHDHHDHHHNKHNDSHYYHHNTHDNEDDDEQDDDDDDDDDNAEYDADIVRYELLGPLNCWKRARHQSMARVECVANDARLTGAQYLECYAGSWRLLTSASSSSPTSTTSSIPTIDSDAQTMLNEPHEHQLDELDVDVTPMQPMSSSWTPARQLAELPTCVSPPSDHHSTHGQQRLGNPKVDSAVSGGAIQCRPFTSAAFELSSLMIVIGIIGSMMWANDIHRYHHHQLAH